MSEYDEQMNGNDLICPYCEESYQLEGEDYMTDQEVEEECDNCGMKYIRIVEMAVTITATPDCLLNGNKHDFIATLPGSAYQECRVCGKLERKQ